MVISESGKNGGGKKQKHTIILRPPQQPLPLPGQRPKEVVVLLRIAVHRPRREATDILVRHGEHPLAIRDEPVVRGRVDDLEVHPERVVQEVFPVRVVPPPAHVGRVREEGQHGGRREGRVPDAGDGGDVLGRGGLEFEGGGFVACHDCSFFPFKYPFFLFLIFFISSSNDKIHASR